MRNPVWHRLFGHSAPRAGRSCSNIRVYRSTMSSLAQTQVRARATCGSPSDAHRRQVRCVRFGWPLQNSAAGDPNDTLPSLFTAMEAQLALKLEPQCGPVDLLVIDHLQRPDADTRELRRWGGGCCYSKPAP